MKEKVYGDIYAYSEHNKNFISIKTVSMRQHQ